MLNFKGFVTAGGTVAAPLVCAYLYVCVSVCDVNSRAQCGEISLWLYLVNAAAADKFFISLILRYRLDRPYYTLPLHCSHSAQHKDTAKATLPPSNPPSSPKPSPPLSCPPFVWSLKAICEPHSCESTLHARCTNEKKGNQSIDTWRGG